MALVNESQKYNAMIKYLKAITPSSTEEANEIEQIISMCENKIAQRTARKEKVRAEQVLVEDLIMKHITGEPQTAYDLRFAIHSDDEVTESYKIPTITAACKRLVAAGKIAQVDVVQERRLVYAYKLP